MGWVGRGLAESVPLGEKGESEFNEEERDEQDSESQSTLD